MVNGIDGNRPYDLLPTATSTRCRQTDAWRADRRTDPTGTQVREMRATGVALNGKRFKLRLWTTLLDPKRYPAEISTRH